MFTGTKVTARKNESMRLNDLKEQRRLPSDALWNTYPAQRSFTD